MKLNKPPVSEEHSVLEEYVDFLLTDNSNVTQLPAKSGADAKPERIVDSNDNEPKWTTIEKATKGFETAEHKIARIKKELDEVVHQNDGQTSLGNDDGVTVNTNSVQSKPQPESAKRATEKVKQNKVHQRVELKPKSKKSAVKLEVESPPKAVTTEPKDDEFSLQAEEEEAKAWDQVLTKEKENTLLKELESNESAQSDQAAAIEQAAITDKTEVEARERRKPEVNSVEQASSSPQTTPKVERPSSPSNESSSIQNATKALIEEYLPHKETDERLAGVEKLLARISLATQPKAQQQTKTKVQQSESVAAENEISQQAAEATFIQRDADKLKDILPDVFQTLIFEVGKMPLAVPLLKLGGIVKVSSEDITPLVGTPDWFVGLVPNDRGNLMVVDTQSYLMPEQPSKSVEEMNYEYLILLDDSNWALACNSVGDAKNLVQDDIRWSERSSRRPWFAGMVVEYMSALIEVDELINLLADTITKK